MQIVRTIIWILAFAILLVFATMNWGQEVTITLWPGEPDVEKLTTVVVAAFLLGLLPMWLVNQGTKWRFQRRIKSLEGNIAAPAPSASSSASPPPARKPAPELASDPALTPSRPSHDGIRG